MDLLNKQHDNHRAIIHMYVQCRMYNVCIYNCTSVDDIIKVN